MFKVFRLKNILIRYIKEHQTEKFAFEIARPMSHYLLQRQIHMFSIKELTTKYSVFSFCQSALQISPILSIHYRIFYIVFSPKTGRLLAMSKFCIQTFGCQMNYSDSERVIGLLERAGWENSEIPETADLVLFNTCSVRQKSEDKAVGAMRKLKQQSPHVCIGVTGCMVRKTGSRTTSNDKILKLDSVDFVFRIEDLGKLPKIMEEFFPGKIDYAEEIQNYFEISPHVKNKKQVFVPIMQGCDKFCAYCIVPHTRGREISRPMQDILDECAKLVQNGALEITLLGQNVNSYVHEGKKCFATLLREVDTFSKYGLKRIRFTSPHPQDFKDDVIDAIADCDTLCPHVHLPAQHGSNRVLKEMQRNYTVEEFQEIVRKIREKIPGCGLVTDIIVGFPGETEEDMIQLLEFGERMKFDFSYTAIFSPRKGTPAAERKDQIPMEEKKDRFRRFDEVIKKHALARRTEFIGKNLKILFEQAKRQPDGMWRCGGRSAEFMEVYCTCGRDMSGEIAPVTITDQDGFILNGKLI